MIQWFLYNIMVFLLCAFSLFGITGGLVSVLSWVVLFVTFIFLVQWIGMVQWVMFNIAVLLLCVFVLMKSSFGVVVPLLSPLAWILLAFTSVLIAKDLIVMRLR